MKFFLIILTFVFSLSLHVEGNNKGIDLTERGRKHVALPESVLVESLESDDLMEYGKATQYITIYAPRSLELLFKYLDDHKTRSSGDVISSKSAYAYQAVAEIVGYKPVERVWPISKRIGPLKIYLKEEGYDIDGTVGEDTNEDVESDVELAAGSDRESISGNTLWILGGVCSVLAAFVAMLVFIKRKAV